MKSQPFSIRLSTTADTLITEEARRTRRSKGAVVEALADEAIRTRLFPGIAFRGADFDRRPWVIGSGLDVWEIVQAHQDHGMDAVRTVAETDLTDSQLRLALAYLARFPEEVEEAIRLNRRDIEELRHLYPTFDVLSI